MSLTANWDRTLLDNGRVLLIKVRVSAEDIRKEVSDRLVQVSRKAPPKGFRHGSRVAGEAVRRVHGKRVLTECRDDLVSRTYDSVTLEEAKRFGFALGQAGRPSNVSFSEEGGLSYEIVVTGIEPETPAAPGGDVVDLRRKESGG